MGEVGMADVAVATAEVVGEFVVTPSSTRALIRRVHGEGRSVLAAIARLPRNARNDRVRRLALEWGRQWNAWRADDPSPMWVSTYEEAARFQGRLRSIADVARRLGADTPIIQPIADGDGLPSWALPAIVALGAVALLMWSPPARAASRIAG